MTLFLTTFQGELAALSAAFIWAIASLVYASFGKQMPPLLLNFLKSSIAILLILLTLGLRQEMPSLEMKPLVLLFVSGSIGIGMGDTAFFTSINCIGARRSLLLEALAPPLTALLAAIFLQEQLGIRACLGIALTIAGVTWVIIERMPDRDVSYQRPQRGILFGVLAAFSQASGAVLSRAAFVETSVSPLYSTLIRLGGGVAVLLLLLLLQRQHWQCLAGLRSRRFLAAITATSFAGTYMAIWLQQTALKYTKAGIAQSLSATSPLFILPVAWSMGEHLSFRAVLGVLIALSGVWLLFNFS
ncbi:DMT family transporter [Thermocoleostomius sinensis]|uniref:DMT family transporter n=1 Tax=Thermocoleostomius sinensis A174 TaxID=2016057 RepID=A0A9E8ZIQ7_9CYAN|nr:DMT family transporter [Thermocoleostomius sinensis]WAL62033.1 DMT family transporter [Thermocoleostomius sinensis A174]